MRIHFRIKIGILATILLLISTSFSFSSYSSSGSLFQIAATKDDQQVQLPELWKVMESFPDKSCHLNQIPEIPVPEIVNDKLKPVSKSMIQFILFRPVLISCTKIYHQNKLELRNITPLLNILQI